MAVVKRSRTRSAIKEATTDAVAVTLYTCPSNCKAHMNLLFITNGSSDASDIEVKWYRAADSASYFILGGKNLSGGEFIQFDGGAFIVLEEGDYIQLTPDNTAGGNNPQIDFFCTVEEFFIPQQSGVS